MVYSTAGSSNLYLILGCIISNFLYLSFSTLYYGSSWRSDTIVFARLNTPPPPALNREISRTSSYRHKYICFSEALEAGALQKTTRHKTTGARLRPSRVYSRNARNYCCESSRVSLTRQMRLGPKKKPIWRRSGHAEHVCF